MRLQDSEERTENVGQEKENKEKEGHQETVDTPLTSPVDDLTPASLNNDVQVKFFPKVAKFCETIRFRAHLIV